MAKDESTKSASAAVTPEAPAQATDPAAQAAPAEATGTTTEATGTGTQVIWKDKREWRSREFRKGDGRGSKSTTGFTRKYVFDHTNDHTVSDMDPADVELLKSIPDGDDFRFVEGSAGS
jgi:hypothetical protein